MKTACVLRWGAFGDCIQCTPIFPLLKKDGYKVFFHTKYKGAEVVRHNPYIDRVIIHKEVIPYESVQKYWDLIGKNFDKFINLSGAIEGRLLIPAKKEWAEIGWSKEKRHEACNKNYYDTMTSLAGYPEATGLNGQLYFSRLEEKRAKKWRKKHKDKFIVLWAISGSSLHKVYPYTEYVAEYLVEKYPDMMIVFVGDAVCEIMETGLYTHPRVKGYSGKFSIRRSLSLSKYVDVVVGPETGMLNAAACFDTPKVVLLSHSTEENLTKYWKNTISVEPDVDCHPCHMLHFSMDYCEKDPTLGSPICMARLDPYKIITPIERIYHGHVGEKRRRNILSG